MCEWGVVQYDRDSRDRKAALLSNVAYRNHGRNSANGPGTFEAEPLLLQPTAARRAVFRAAANSVRAKGRTYMHAKADSTCRSYDLDSVVAEAPVHRRHINVRHMTGNTALRADRAGTTCFLHDHSPILRPLMAAEAGDVIRF